MSDDKQPDEKGLLMLGSLMSSDLERQLAFAKEAAEHADKLVDLLNKCLTVISYAHTWLFFPEQKLSDGASTPAVLAPLECHPAPTLIV